MSTAAILSIKPQYANQILSGTKTIELRKSSMGLNPGDVILVYSSAPEQSLTFWFLIKDVEELPVNEMWDRYQDRLGIGNDDYVAYFSDSLHAVGFHVGKLHPIQSIPLKEIVALVPGFVPPQGILWFRDGIGRYEKLLSRLSDPLPRELFPQQSLGLEFV